MSFAEQFAIMLGSVVAFITVTKAGYNMAKFFSELSSDIRALTEAIKEHNAKLDAHNTTLDLHGRDLHAVNLRLNALERGRRHGPEEMMPA